MVSKSQLIDEVLVLVDAMPLTEIDVKPILDKYTNGVDFNGQKTIRQNLDSAISDLVRVKDIRSRNCNFSASSGGQFLSNSGLVASTLERKEKLEQIERDKQKNHPTHQTTFNAPFTGNFRQGDGDTQQIFNDSKKSEKPKWLTLNFYWEEFIKHWFKLLLVAIGAAILVLLKQCDGKDKSLDKKEQTLPTVQGDTTTKKDTADQ